MSSTMIAILLKPLAGLILFGLIVAPIKMLLYRVIPNGKVKDLLFREFGKKTNGRAPKYWS